MNEKKIKNLPCYFGQYDKSWGNHKDNCKKIIRITGNYIVFIDNRNNIDWETTEAYDTSIPREINGNRMKALSQCLITEHKPTGGLSEASILSFKTIVSEAIVNCLENSFDECNEILKRADEFRIDRVVEKSREWYLSFTVIISSILIFITLLISSKNILIWEGVLEYINIGTWAVAGACLSIILRSGQMQNASYAGKKLHFIESGCRLISGFISGQIVYLGVKSGILFASLVDANNTQHIIYFLALLTGASERFAPSIITKIEDSASLTETIKEN
jgi:predicted small secreted protein